MSRAVSMRMWTGLLALVLSLLWVPGTQAGPPMMDPKQASGIPRVDPQVAAGTITVRCLLGGFDQPATGLTVKLELQSADGAKHETRDALTAEAGRANFEGLQAFLGGSAVASVDFGGEVVRSQPIPLDPSAGSRVMLVKGAGGPAANAAGGTGQGAHGGSDVPRPGQPFALQGRPAGTIVAGALDLERGGPMGGIEITLRARTPGMADQAEPIVRKQATADDGRAVFEGLVPPEFPEGTRFWLEARLAVDEPVQRSEEFAFEGEAVAVVLARGRAEVAPSPTPPPRRRPTMAPRSDSTVAAGTVRVRVIDAADRPVADLEVSVVKKDMTGDDVTYAGTTDAMGVASIAGVPVENDAFYFAGAIHDGAPYQSTFFQLPETSGASVELRVFPTTADRTRIRSGVHYEVHPLENDAVQIIRVYEVLVEGDEAFWPSGGMRLHGEPGSRFVKVLPRSSEWLEEREGAPFAVLTGPIPPGEIVELSIAYVVDHDGEVTISWKAPFPLVQAGIALKEGLDLVRGGQGPPETPEHPTAEPVRLWRITPPAFVEGPCSIALREHPDFRCPDLVAALEGTRVELEVAGLPTRPTLYHTLAIGFGAVVLLIVAVALLLRPRVSNAQALRVRRDALLEALRRLPAEGADAERERILAALDRIYRQLDALSAPAAGASSGVA